MAVARVPRLVCALILATAACRGAAPPVTQRLVDLYKPELVLERVAPEPAPPRLEWRFDGAAGKEGPARGGKGLDGVADVAVRDGRLVGRTTNDFPILDFALPKAIEDTDLVHEIEVRLRVDAGGNVSARLTRGEKVDVAEVLDTAKVGRGWATSTRKRWSRARRKGSVSTSPFRAPLARPGPRDGGGRPGRLSRGRGRRRGSGDRAARTNGHAPAPLGERPPGPRRLRGSAGDPHARAPVREAGHPRLLGRTHREEPRRDASRAHRRRRARPSSPGRDRRLGGHPAARPPRSLRLQAAHFALHRSARPRGDGLPRRGEPGFVDQGLDTLPPHLALPDLARREGILGSDPRLGPDPHRGLPGGRLRHRLHVFRDLHRQVHEPPPGLRGAARGGLPARRGDEQDGARLRGPAVRLVGGPPRLALLRPSPRDRPPRSLQAPPALRHAVRPGERRGRARAPGQGRAEVHRGSPPEALRHAEPEGSGAPAPHGTASVAIVEGPFKLVQHSERAAGSPEYQLFDHRTDPLDLQDVAAKRPDVVARLARDLAAWQRTAEAARLKPDTDAEKALSKEELERLRALGYIQ